MLLLHACSLSRALCSQRRAELAQRRRRYHVRLCLCRHRATVRAPIGHFFRNVAGQLNGHFCVSSPPSQTVSYFTVSPRAHPTGSQSGSAAPVQPQVPSTCTRSRRPGGYSIVASEVSLSQRTGGSLSLWGLSLRRHPQPKIAPQPRSNAFLSLVWYPRHRSNAQRTRSARPRAPLLPLLM